MPIESSSKKTATADVKKLDVLMTREDLLVEFFTLISDFPDLADQIHSLHLTHDSYLGSIANEAFSTSTEDWKQELLQKLKSIKRLESLDEPELEAFKDAVRTHLEEGSIKEEKDDVLPNILLVTPNPSKSKQKVTAMYNSASKKKFKIGLAKFAWIMLFLPNLKIIKSNNINFKVERNDSITDEEGRIECVDISLGNTVTSPTTLLNSIITNYHKSLKSIKLVTGERKDKWLPFDGDADELVDISPFKADGIDLEHLESVDLSFFGYMVNTDRFLDELVKTNCRLKDLTLLGCVYGRSVLYTITNYYSDCLESLKLSTEYYCDPSELKKMERLRHFSYIWENLEEKVDILKILKMIPNLTSLELGYSRLNSDIVNNDINLNSYTNLTQLSLHRLNLEGGELYNLQKQLPHLDELFLTSCKFGKSRIEKKATLDLRNYTLGKLVLESCSLHFSKKEAKNKRLITRFKFNILQEEPYVVNLESTVNDEGRIVAEGGSFVYELGKRNEFTLLVKITSMEKFSCSKSLDEYVGFLPESEIEVNGNVLIFIRQMIS